MIDCQLFNVNYFENGKKKQKSKLWFQLSFLVCDGKLNVFEDLTKTFEDVVLGFGIDTESLSQSMS